MWQLFVRTAYTNLKLTVHKVPTGSELADILTKAMPKEGGESFRRTAGALLGYSFT